MVRLFMRLQQFLYIKTGGRIGHRLIGVPSLLLWTKGRRSGLERTATLVYGRDGDAFVVVASNHGLDTPPGWFFNLQGDRSADVQIARSRFRARARTVEKGDPDFERLWSLMNRVNHNRYDAYQGKTSRPIPLVVLDPVR